MSNMLASFANSFLKFKMFMRLLLRLIILIGILQLGWLLAYNFYLNKAWPSQTALQLTNLASVRQWIAALEFNQAANEIIRGIILFWEFQKSIFYQSCYMWLLLPIIFLYHCLFAEDKNLNDEYIRGAQAISPDELNCAANKKGTLDIFWRYRLRNCIPLGQVSLPVGEEIKQNFIIGKPGSGKTNAFNQMIAKIRERRQKIIVHDYKGDYVENLFNPKVDIIFNPLDTRSVGWCLFNDCKSVMDVEGFAAALIPNASPGSDPFWNNAARDVMVGILRYCHGKGKITNRDIWETSIIPNDKLYGLLRTTRGGERGAKHIEDASSKTAASIMSNLMQYVKVFEYMAPMKGSFSISNWVEDKQTHGIIFITNYAKLQNTLSPIISLFIQTVGSVLLSQSDDLSNRVFFFLDEFGQLQNLSTIPNLMTASRSKGGSIFIGVQDIGQIDRIYGKDTRTSLLNSAANRVIFNCKDHDTAKFLSTDIGETEYFEALESQSLGMSAHDRINTSRQRRKELLVTPEDIQTLPDLSAFISIGHHNIILSQFRYKEYAKKSPAFIQRPELDLSNSVDIEPFDPSKVAASAMNHDYLKNPAMVSGYVRADCKPLDEEPTINAREVDL